MARLPFLFCSLLLPFISLAETDEDKSGSTGETGWPSHYSKGRKTFDGTGKYYMGREISYVMGHQAIRWLERGNREEEEAPSKAIAALNLKPISIYKYSKHRLQTSRR